MKLVKIGSTYYNIDKVTEIRDTGVDIELFFTSDKASTLRGADAEKMRRWLGGISEDLNRSTDSND